ncbi:MAG: hypothetical protein J3R72DRAFT_435560 [Linnemannia gamsii]|nr:MAG: hypothetical protein J3R72DRAFT_435560 [Linnemannia gamsii]
MSTMSFKPTFMMLLALVVLLVVVVIQTEAVTVPVWCVCGNGDHSARLCSITGGKWDGGSCGMITTRAYENYNALCNNDKSYKGTPHCWN